MSLWSRERKVRLFLELFDPGPQTTVLDVGVTDAPFGGGSTDNYFEARYPWPEQITAVGTTGLERFAAAFPCVRVVQADGRELPFADREFDLCFSNAVVEHVQGGRAGQRRFVGELCRVARRVFVTTPNRWFPVIRTRCCRLSTGSRPAWPASVCCGGGALRTCSTRSARGSSPASFPIRCA